MCYTTSVREADRERGGSLTKGELHEKFALAVTDAHEAGVTAVEKLNVTPMLVGTPKNLVGSLMGGDDGGFNTEKPVYYVADGVCGFGWVNLKAEKGEAGAEARKFLNFVKGTVKTDENVEALFAGTEFSGLGRTDSYYGGVTMWVGGFGQSYQKKVAYASAVANVLNERVEGLRAWGTGRLD
jgi:hypothetical protein